MRFGSPLIKGTLIKRYKRFLADVYLEGHSKPVTIHCPNSGSMLGLTKEGSSVWASKSLNLKRKLPYTWEIGEEDGVLVGVNTQNPNKIIAEALKEKIFNPFIEYTSFKKEVCVGANSRIDFALEHEGRISCHIEVKNVHLKRDKQAAFPDAKTVRGVKHLEELISLKHQGFKSVQLYVIQRPDLESFTIAEWIDPLYAKVARTALRAGVIFIAYDCLVSPLEIKLNRQIPIDFL